MCAFNKSFIHNIPSFLFLSPQCKEVKILHIPHHYNFYFLQIKYFGDEVKGNLQTIQKALEIKGR